MFQSIRLRFLLSLIVLCAGTMAVSLLGILWVIDSSQSQRFNDSFDRTEQVVRSQLGVELYKITRNAELISSLPILRAVMELGDPQTTKDSAQAHQEDLNLPVFLVLDPKGQPMANVGEVLNKGELDEIRSRVLPHVKGVKSHTAMVPVGDKLILGAIHVIGPREDQLGYLFLGAYIDAKFIARIKLLTDGTVGFYVNGKQFGFSQDEFTPEVKKYVDSLDTYHQSAYDTVTSQTGLIRATHLHNILDDMDGFLLINKSLEEANQTKSSIIKEIGRIALIALILSFLVGWWLASSLSKPIVSLTEMAKKVTLTKDLTARSEPVGKDEIFHLSNAFNQLLDVIQKNQEELEVLVDERTGELGKAHDNMELLLDNLNEGFLVFDKSERILPGASKMSHELFQRDPTGVPFYELIGAINSKQVNIKKWTTVLFKSSLPFEDLTRLGPQSLNLKETGQYIELRYRPIYSEDGDGKTLDRVICIASDKTEEQKFKARLKKDQDLHRMIAAVSKNKKSFKVFIKGTQTVLKDLRDVKVSSTSDAKRLLHTIKGNASLFYMRELVAAVHDVETEVKERDLDVKTNPLEFLVLTQELFGVLNRTLHQIAQILGDVGLDDNIKPVDADKLEEVAVDIGEELGYDSPVYRKYMETFVLSNFVEAFEPFELKVHQVAQMQQKPIDFKVVNEDAIFVHLRYYDDFVSSLIHVFTNAIIHGIEHSKERVLSGKELRGEVSVHVSQNPEGCIELKITDDGRGVNEKQILEKAVSLGLVTKKEAAFLSSSEIYDFLFADDFSTDESVSNLAGRGVGLAAVKFELEKLSGKYEVNSEKNRGTTFIFTIPILAYKAQKTDEELLFSA